MEVEAVSTAVVFGDVMDHFKEVPLCQARWRDLWLVVDACRHLAFATALTERAVLQQLCKDSLIFSCPLTAFYSWDSGDASSPSLTSEWRFHWVRPSLCMPLCVLGRVNAIAASKMMFAALTRLLVDALSECSHLSLFVHRLHSLRNIVQFGAGHSNLLCWNSWVELQSCSLMEVPEPLVLDLGPLAAEDSPSSTEEPESPSISDG